ncbi:MAG: orotate phosphoribosyltransferase [Elusimicrobia bacterium]|nr:orotate phosphoribosyltransferase [Elusimicrobiota bacterium]
MDLLKLFKEKGALLEGHFLLSSGLHSNRYIQCAKILQYPDIAEKLAELLVTHYTSHVTRSEIDAVVSPAVGGIIIGQEIARRLKCRAIFCERENGSMKFRRGFEIKRDEKCLVVEDVITTGGSTKEVIILTESFGGKVSGVLSIIDRSDLQDFSVSLLKLKIDTYKPESCPLCKGSIPLVKPGSRTAVTKNDGR